MKTSKITIIGSLLILILFSVGETGKAKSLPHPGIQTGATENAVPRIQPPVPPFSPMTACVFLLFALVLFVIFFAGMWKVYTKAGEPGWAVLIPIYNSYVLARIGDKPGWMGILASLAGFIPIAGPFIAVVLGIIINFGVAKTFGKGVGFGLGLCLLPFIFYLILGFGSSEATGPEGKAEDYPRGGAGISGQQFFAPTPASAAELPPIPMPEEPVTQRVPQYKPDSGSAEQKKAEKDCIHFSCSCGKRFKVPMELAGKVGKCPQCKMQVRIPDK